jgi:uncharacterized alkaline shock family protein YloU
MWFLTRVAILFYVSIIWTASIAVMLFVGHVLDLQSFNRIIDLIYFDPKVGTVVTVVCGVIMFMSFLLARLIYGRRQKERTIAFDNPNGPVTVSLVALEDLVKRLIVQVPEAKEIRPYIIAVKKGLEADIKIILRHETNIPEMTARFQDLVRRKIEDAIGMEGKINIRVHVTKVSLDDIKGKRPVETFVPQPTVPFHGYRA